MRASRALNSVKKAIANHAYFKIASRDLEKLAPDAAATQALIEAFRGRSAPAWLVAHLLGCNGHDDGYALVREILLSAPGLLAESYAGVALTKIRGNRAFDDLASLLTEAPHKASREGAAYGLRELGGPVAIRIIAAAGRDGHIKPSVAASILAKLPTPSRRVIELVDSDTERGLLIAAWLIHFRETSSSVRAVPHWNRQETAELGDALRTALARHGGALSELRRRHLNQWLERQDEAK